MVSSQEGTWLDELLTEEASEVFIFCAVTVVVPIRGLSRVILLPPYSETYILPFFTFSVISRGSIKPENPVIDAPSLELTISFVVPGVRVIISSCWLYLTTSSFPFNAPLNTELLYSIAPLGETLF